MSDFLDILTFPLIPRRRVSGINFGHFVANRRGIGYDHRGSRPWSPGDDIRQLDHKTTARQSAAKGYFDPWVRERHAEVSLRAMVVVDRSIRMQRFPAEFPWLKKPEVIVRAGRMIVASAKEAE